MRCGGVLGHRSLAGQTRRARAVAKGAWAMETQGTEVGRLRAPSAAVTLVVMAATALLGCGGSDSKPAAKPASATATASAASASETARAGTWTHGYPSSIAVLGHSGATGESSDPDQPGVEVRKNSWATGSNPKVDSVYSRILERNPEIKGNNLNLAQGGATVDELMGQAEELVATEPASDLIVVQIMDNDLVCPASSTALSDFQSKLTSSLKTLSQGLPDATIFVVSQFGSVPSYAKALNRGEAASIGGVGPCDFALPHGRLVPANVDRLEKAIHAYEAQLESACKQVQRCTYDDGAFGRTVDKREYTSLTDLNHMSISGHAKAAAVAWTAMKRAHVLPRRG
jgi:hypothetical protein